VCTWFEQPIIDARSPSLGDKESMSKRGSPLVTYSSSDDEGIEAKPEGPPKKKK